MLSLNLKNNQLIIDTIIAFHRTGELLKNNPAEGVLINDEKNLQIDYGFEQIKYGAIVIKKGKFDLIEVTNAKGEFVKLENYNHYENPNKTKQDYIDALKCKNLNKDQKKASALIILLSESCKSQMVLGAIMKLLNSHDFSPLPEEVWNGLEFAFKHYGKIAAFLKYKINPGQEPWEPLIVQNYLDYISSNKSMDKRAEKRRYIEEVDEFLQEDNNFSNKPNLITTYPYSYTLDSGGNKKFIFEFSFEISSEETGKCDPKTSRYVSYRLLRSDKHEEVYYWKGCISNIKKHSFCFCFPDDRVDIYGSLLLFKNADRNFIWLEAKHGFELEEHFEGNIVEIPRE